MWHFLAYNVPDNAQLRLGVRVRSTGLPSPQPIFPLSLALAGFFFFSPGSSHPKPPHSDATVIFCFHSEKSPVSGLTWVLLAALVSFGGRWKTKSTGALWGFTN